MQPKWSLPWALMTRVLQIRDALKQAVPQRAVGEVISVEAGDDVWSAWLLRLGLHTSYNGYYNALPNRKVEQIASKVVPVRIEG